MIRGAVIRLLFCLLGGGDTVVTVYTTLIVKGYKTFTQVPVNLQPAVEDELEALGLGTDGKPLPNAA
jgi:hypothetical protein